MAHAPKTRSDILADLDNLLKQVCVEWGFCSRLTASDLTAGRTMLDPGTFADAVLQAESLVPVYEPEWKRRLEAKFMERYGAAITFDSNVATDRA